MSSHLNFGNDKKVESLKTSHNEKPPYSPQWFFIRSSIYQFIVLKTSVILLFAVKVVEIFQLHVICWMSNDSPAKISRNYNYANAWTISQSKSLPVFWVVTSLDGINGRSIQTLLREYKRFEVIIWNSGWNVWSFRPVWVGHGEIWFCSSSHF